MSVEKRARRGWVGLGLVGLLVVLALAMLVYFGTGGGGSSYSQQIAKSRQTARDVRADIETSQLVLLIAQTRESTGKVPETVADFEDVPASVFKDPWGADLTWAYDDPRSPRTVTFRSAGPDGEQGTEDDVSKTATLPF